MQNEIIDLTKEEDVIDLTHDSDDDATTFVDTTWVKVVFKEWASDKVLSTCTILVSDFADGYHFDQRVLAETHAQAKDWLNYQFKELEGEQGNPNAGMYVHFKRIGHFPWAAPWALMKDLWEYDPKLEGIAVTTDGGPLTFKDNKYF